MREDAVDPAVTRQCIPGIALLLAALALACSDSTDPPVTPPPPVEATLAFTMDSSIYLISTAEGATPSLLLSGFIYPSWSPDGRTIAMVATAPPLIPRLPRQALYLADADGGNLRALTELGDPIGRILWSPDGSSLLFPRSHTVMPSSSHIARVAAAGGVEDAPFGNWEDAVRYDGLPSWSGEGSRVALDHGGNIYVANADGSDRTQLSAGAYPLWSPTSDDIAYWQEDGHIHLIHPDGSGARDLGLEGYPEAWSPDGSHLAFARVHSDTAETISEIWIAAADGSDPVRIGPAGTEVTGVAWSADNKRISYMVRVPGDSAVDRWTIYLSSPNGSNARPLVAAAQILCCISSWRPPDPASLVQSGQ
jgi:Tol biopolymer transport system component